MRISYLLKRSYTSLLLFVFCLLSNIAVAQNKPSSHIYIKGETITPGFNIDEWVSFNKNIDAPQLVLIHFASLPNEFVKQKLSTNGIQLLDYIPDNSYVSKLSVGYKASTLREYAVFVTPFKDEWKIDTRVIDMMDKGVKSLNIIVSTYSTVNRNIVDNFLSKLHATIIPSEIERYNKYKLTISTAKLLDLSKWYGTKYISLLEKDIPLNYECKTAVGLSSIASSPINGGYGLKGDGMVIGVGDNTSGNCHIDLKDRIINFNPTTYTEHGVHINGIVGGAGIVDPKGEGMAPHATLINHLYSFILDQAPSLYQKYHMTVTNNSYAAAVGNCSYSGEYDALSEMVDELALSNDNILHIFASGNDGYLDCSPLPKGFGTVTGGYQPAKNNVVVTSTNKWFINASDASRGPVKDGRLKPEITAIGVDVNSTTKTEEYLVSGGTSMASPQVAGGAAIIAQRYKQNNGGIDPKSDVLKTILLNGSTDIGLPGPDFRFGFGFMNVERSIQILDSNWYYTNMISNSAQQKVNIVVPANIAKLKVMLCYHDPAANPSSSKQLVNDLDLEITDPNNIVHLPLVPDPSIATITTQAIERVDRLNNTEQVIINNPTAGSYTINVKGFSIPSGSQRYVIAYDFEPKGIELKYPREGAQVKAGDSLRIYWYASDDSNNITLEYSSNNGGNWNIIDNAIFADTTYYVWYVPEHINSGECLMRITRNGTSQTYTTGQFIINRQPEVKLSSTQCPGYMSIQWDKTPSATSYEILQKTGAQLAIIDTTTDTTYTLNGLTIDKYAYVAVRPIINGLQGYRSLAVNRLPNTGNCIGSISDNDLLIGGLTNPINGRKNSTLELTTNEDILVEVINLDDVLPDSFRLSYSINNGAWVSKTFTPISSKGIYSIGTEDMSSLGSYDIIVAVENLGAVDPVSTNDTLSVTIRHLKNDVIDLTNKLTDGFENVADITLLNDSLGFDPNERWDFYASDTGRMRSYPYSNVIIEGNRSISLDAYKNTGIAMSNSLKGIFNLSNYKAGNTEVRLEFDYIIHGIPNRTNNNIVSIREHADEAATIAKIFQYNTNRAFIGAKQNSGSLSISDALLSNGLDFTSDIGIEFLQVDSTCIAAINYGAGITIDNVTLYTVQNDMQLLEVISPTTVACERSNESPVTISVRNGVSQMQNDVEVYFQLNNEPIVKETIQSIGGKQVLNYTFNKTIDISSYENYTLKTWLVANGDSYHKNDSLQDIRIRTQPRVRVFPYIENFNNRDGNWYSSGINSSWEYGLPNGNVLKADTGGNAWVTDLDGNYNDMEVSYLTSPCFDISDLSNPTLSFNMALDIESCGFVLCDAAYLEYTVDGTTWERLDKTLDTREYANWYNDTGYRIWSKEGDAQWRKAIISLPKSGGESFQLRFVLRTDQGATFEGIAIDDIVIEDRKYYAATNDVITIGPNPTRDGKINIEWAATAGTQMQIIMANILGKQVYSTTEIANEGYNRTSIQTPYFSSGIYLMRIIIGDKEQVYKIVYQ